MRSPRVRLVLAALLFLAWTGWLAYQVARTADPIVVSRPQVLAAPVVVEANVTAWGKGLPPEPREKVRVHEILRGQETLGLKQGEPVPANLELIVTFHNVQNQYRGWKGEGMYFLCLEPAGEGKYRLVRPPVSPGFHPEPNDEARLASIYLVTESTRAQIEEALKDKP